MSRRRYNVTALLLAPACSPSGRARRTALSARGFQGVVGFGIEIAGVA